MFIDKSRSIGSLSFRGVVYFLSLLRFPRDTFWRRQRVPLKFDPLRFHLPTTLIESSALQTFFFCFFFFRIAGIVLEGLVSDFPELGFLALL